MAEMISSLLDYETNTYIEPFGGACRVLLSKPRHEAELYNDLGHGLTTFFEVMTSSTKTELLIDKLLDNPPSEDEFNELVIQRMEMEDRVTDALNKTLSALALECYRKYKINTFRELRKAIRDENYKDIVDILSLICKTPYIGSSINGIELEQYFHYLNLYGQFLNIVKNAYRSETVKRIKRDFDNEWKKSIGGIPKQGDKLYGFYKKHKEQCAKEYAIAEVHSYTNDYTLSNRLGEVLTDVEKAYIIFKLYYSSRDGMGVAWSAEKNRSQKAYIKAVGNLRNVSQRMQNVIVTQYDALELIKQYRTENEVMLYLDPSYLKPEDEYRDLGEVYKMSYSYQDHEKLLTEITKEDTRAKILISNYDVELYNRYLYDWEKVYYETYTGVGSKKGNKRVEVLWKNY